MHRPLALAFILCLIACACASQRPLPTATNSEEDLSRYFAGFDATFVLLDVEANRTVRFNPARTARRLPPCSTFKIPNALIGLETGVLTGPDHAMAWDGTKRWLDAWNQDQTLRTAMSRSCVWYFQRVAAGIGEQRMREYVHKLGYGNEDLSGGLTQFWLDSSLAISADEQVEFARRLAVGTLPFSAKTIETVRELIRVEETERGVLHGKTGSARASSAHAPLGWFVGYVEHGGRTFAFATNIEGAEASGAVAREITARILRERGLL